MGRKNYLAEAQGGATARPIWEDQRRNGKTAGEVVAHTIPEKLGCG
jgi:hypothetical protein